MILPAFKCLDAAVLKELGDAEGAESAAFCKALSTLLSRWLLTRSPYPEMEAIKLLATVHNVTQPERFL